MREVSDTGSYRRNVKLLARRNWDVGRLDSVIVKLATDAPHTELFKDHPLKGEWAGKRECHVTSITDDWLLVYEKPDDSHLILHGTGDHQMLFGE